MARTRGPSVQKLLLSKSREATLNAVQTFNNPLSTFKAETFIVLMTIAWMYLMHAYYRREGVEYRYYDQGPRRRKFDLTNAKAYKYWELERCLNEKSCPLDSATKQNLRFLIGLRHKIEHHMPAGFEDRFSGRYLACCLNYERYICELFGNKYSLVDHAAFTLHFRDFTAPQEHGETSSPLPSDVAKYVQAFDAKVDAEDFQSPYFSYRTIFVRKQANHPGQADQAIEFIGDESELAQEIDRQYWVVKGVEKPKYIPSQIIQIMRDEGYTGFTMYNHTQLWKEMDPKDVRKGYGVTVANSWFWYDRWLERVREHCSSNLGKYIPGLAA